MWEMFRNLLLLNLVLLGAGCLYKPAIPPVFTGSSCPQDCKCTMEENIILSTIEPVAKCSLKKIPKGFSPETQRLYFDENDLYSITSHAFNDTGLINLKKLSMKHCKLEVIENNGFSGLPSLEEIFLDDNLLKTLHADTFKDLVEIEWISMRNNQIETLEDGLFKNLPFLTEVSLSNNRIVQIGEKTFMNLPMLWALILDSNRLEYLNTESFRNLNSLRILELSNNPWQCDCSLRPFRDWYIDNNIRSSFAAALCAKPDINSGKPWDEIDSNNFACPPFIVNASSTTTVQKTDTNVTLWCQGGGDPLPEVNWGLNVEIINETDKHEVGTQYYITRSDEEKGKWVNLTIIGADTRYSGEYFCVAKNPAGVAKRKLTFAFPHKQPIDTQPDLVDPIDTQPEIIAEIGKSPDSTVVVIWVLAIGAVVTLIAIVCFCCRRRLKAIRGLSKQAVQSQPLEYAYVPAEKVSVDAARALIAGNKRIGEQNFIPRLHPRPWRNEYDYATPQITQEVPQEHIYEEVH